MTMTAASVLHVNQSLRPGVAKNLCALDQPWSYTLNKQSFKTCIWRFAGGVGTTPLPRIARSICASWPLTTANKSKLVSHPSIISYHLYLFLRISFASLTPCDSMPIGTQQHCQGHHLQVGPAVPDPCKGLGRAGLASCESLPGESFGKKTCSVRCDVVCIFIYVYKIIHDK